MDVGTAKPTPAERARVPHHLIDVAEPSEPFSVARYQEAARDGAGRRSRRVAIARCSSAARACTSARWSTSSSSREPIRDASRAGARGGRARRRPLHERLDGARPGGGGKIEPANVRRTVRALEVARDHRPAVLGVRRGVGALPAASGARRRDRACLARSCSRGSRHASRDARGGLARRGAGAGRARVRRLAHLDPGHRLR